MASRGHGLNVGYKVFSAGQYKIRQRGKKYYVHSIEKDSKGNVKERYIGPLDKIIEFYVSNGDISKVGLAGFEPATTRAQAWHPSPG